MTKIAEIKQKIKGLKDQAVEVLNKENATLEEINEINNSIALEESKLELAEKSVIQNKGENVQNKGKIGKKLENDFENSHDRYKTAFLNYIKRDLNEQDLSILDAQNSMSAVTGEDGGFLVPHDQETSVRELLRTYLDLGNYVYKESVTTLSGTRNIEKNAEYTGLTKVASEGNAASSLTGPKLKQIQYTLSNYAGILKVPNSLLRDSDQNVLNYITIWAVKKDLATNNMLVLDLLKGLTKADVTDFDGIKTAYNTELDPAISASSVFVTNQTGFNFLDTLKDGDNNYILQTNPTDSTKKMINSREVLVFPDAVLANDTTAGTKSPLFIGNLNQFCTLFDRFGLEIAVSDTAGDAFANLETHIRLLARKDCKTFDEKAAVYKELVVIKP